MEGRRNPLLWRAAVVLGLGLVLASCTKGGQFDPTTLLDNDMFDTKKKLTGDRQPVFPNGVPGTTTGVPPDLVKGYQAPPDTDADAAVPVPAPPTAAAAPAKPKPKPRPKVAVQKPPTSQPTRIDLGAKGSPGQPPPPAGGWPAPQENAPTAWPAPPPTAAQPQSAQTAWPSPQTAPTAWPAPPPTGAAPKQ